MKNHKSFFYDGTAQCKIYQLNRDSKYRSEVRSKLDLLWQTHGHLCGEIDFRKQAMGDFHAASWHLQVLELLSHSAVKLEKSDPVGPDIKGILNNRRIWIECVAVRPGDGPDRVENPPEMSVYSPADEKIILRHTHAIRGKSLKFQEYLQKGIVSNEDLFIIALNVGAIPDADYTPNKIVTFLEMATLGIGDEQIHISSDNGEVRETSFQTRFQISKPSSRESITTDGFLRDEYSTVSGVLYSYHHFANSHFNLIDTIHLLHNPKAQSPISIGAIPCAFEKWVENQQLRYEERKSD